MKNNEKIELQEKCQRAEEMRNDRRSVADILSKRWSEQDYNRTKAHSARGQPVFL